MAQMRAVKGEEQIVMKRSEVEETHALLREVCEAEVLPEDPQNRALVALGRLHLALGLPTSE